MQNVWIDHDGSIDDAMAVIFIRAISFLQKKINLLGMSIPNTGEVHSKEGAENFARLLKLLGCADIPIAYGTEEACSKDGKPFPKWLRDAMDVLFQDKDLPNASDVVLSSKPIELLKKTIDEKVKETIDGKGKLTILVTGPLTNIAHFINKYPSYKDKIDIVMMGGAVDVPGNIKDIDENASNEVAEWNIYADPEAFNIVAKAGIPITLVPLDATNQVPLTKKFYEKLSQQQHPELKLIYQMLKSLVDKLGEEFFFKKFFMWDPLAAMILDKPERATIETIKVKFDVKEANIKRAKENDTNCFEIKVVTGVPHPEKILDDFFDTIERFSVERLDKAKVSRSDLYEKTPQSQPQLKSEFSQRLSMN